MKCKQCGMSLPENTKTCLYCNTSTSGVTDVVAATNPTTRQPSRFKKELRFVLLYMLLPIIGVFLYLGLSALISIGAGEGLGTVLGEKGLPPSNSYPRIDSSYPYSSGTFPGYSYGPSSSGSSDSSSGISYMDTRKYIERNVLCTKGFTYFAYTNNEERFVQILKLDDADDAHVQEVYRFQWTEDYSGTIELIGIQNDILYFSEYYYSYRTRAIFDIALRSLDLKKEGSAPTTIDMHLKQGTIPSYLATMPSDTSRYLYEIILDVPAADNNYLYMSLLSAESKETRDNMNAVLFQLDYTNGGAVCFDRFLGEYIDQFVLLGEKGGFVYFYSYVKGLCRISLPDLDIEVIAELSGDQLFRGAQIIGDRLYLFLSTSATPGNLDEIHCIDLNTKKDFALIISTQVFPQVQVVPPYITNWFAASDDTLYYFENGDLRSCNPDGSNNQLLIAGKGGEDEKYMKCLSGQWIYYTQTDPLDSAFNRLYRVKLDDAGFPTVYLY